MQARSKFSAVILAGGKGRRLGSEFPKAFVNLNRKPMFLYSVYKMERLSEIEEIILVVPRGYKKKAENILRKEGVSKVKNVVIGGSVRARSSYNGLQAVSDDIDYVIIHDAARPLVTVQNIKILLRSALRHGAVIPGLKQANTLKQVNEQKIIIGTLDRESVYEVQTPQVFKKEILEEAFRIVMKRKLDFKGFTDDAMVVEQINFPVKVEKGSSSNVKITIKGDKDFAAKMLRCKKKH